MRVTKYILFLLFFYSVVIFGQSDNTRLGAANKIYSTTGGSYDFSEPGSVNMQVTVWGYVRFPGRYIVPVNKTVADMISFAGGPVTDATLEDIRLVRILADSTQQITYLDYNELLYEPKVTKNIKNPQVLPGDMIMVTGEPRFYFRDYFSMTLSIVSTLISLAILVLNIVRN